MHDKLQLYRRMVFNVIMRNQDDHTKNISFLMNRQGIWRLSPAYDITYSYNPNGAWTANHQMTLNAKRDKFTHEDLIQVAKNTGLNTSKCRKIIQQVQTATQAWPGFAQNTLVNQQRIDAIQSTFRKLM
jgi:serine/threonine-protein kinase HipA